MFSWTKTKTGLEIRNTTSDITGISGVVFYLDDKFLYINSDTTPNIVDYLSHGAALKIPLKYAGVWWLREYLLKQVPIGQYTVGDNIIIGDNIAAQVEGDYVFADKLYQVDKTLSVGDTLVLTKPIKGTFLALYSATKYEESVHHIHPIEDIIKKRHLEIKCCPDPKLYDAQSFLVAFNDQAGYNNHESKKLILDKIKNTLNIRC